MKNPLVKIILLIVTGLFFSCSNNAATFTIGGTAAGINGNITLQNNGKDDFIITNDVTFVFDTALEKGQTYNVTVSKHPAGQTCTVSHGKGTVAKKITDIGVTCAPTSGAITVDVTHLNGTVVLQNNGGDDLTISANGSYIFATEIAMGGDFEVTILTQPTNQTCQIAQGLGVLANGGATVSVVCGKIIFVSTTTYDGSFGTVTIQSTGDHLCDIDPGNPDSTKSYKTLQVGGGSRAACTTANCSGGISEHNDWVLTPDTTYVRADDTIIFTTNSDGIFNFSGSFINSFAAGGQVKLWTGLNNDWTTAANNCVNWGSNNNADNGTVGYSDATDSNAIAASTDTCDIATMHLICVEQ